MKSMMIVIDICSLGDKANEIFIIKKFFRDSCRSLTPSSSSMTSRTCRLRRSFVVLRPMMRDFVAMMLETSRSTSYLYTQSCSH